jgi:hypothetical protein
MTTRADAVIFQTISAELLTVSITGENNAKYSNISKWK